MISLKNISKTYTRNDGAPVVALKDISFEVARGEFLTLRGASGSGKSSLLNIMGCLDRPTSGEFMLEGTSLAGLPDRELSRVRGQHVGFVFQAFHLLPRATALENVELPMIYSGRSVDRARAMAALARVGLQDHARHYGAELSGGQQQRVALARALSNDPPLILADEPTGNLDSEAGTEVMTLLASLHGEGRTIVLVTHDDSVAAYAGREIRIGDGRVVSDGAAGAKSGVEEKT